MGPHPLKTVLTGLLLFFAQSVWAQPGPITIQINTPTAHSAVDSNLTVQVTIQSTYQINSVVAAVRGRNSTLTYNAGLGLYTGTLSLAGLPVAATDTLMVTATDAVGNTQIVSESFLFDPPPNLTILQPYSNAVGRPTINIKATCAASAGHCQMAVSIIEGTMAFLVGNYTDSVNTMVDVSAYQGLNNMQVRIIAQDSLQVQSSQDQDFLVETSPYLTPLYSSNNQLVDLLGNRQWAYRYG